MLSEDKQLEIKIDREIKALPELHAPPSLLVRVMAAINAMAQRPWYRRPWATWPDRIRWSSFVGLLALFGGLCYGSWGVSNAAAPAVSQKLSVLTTIWNALNDLFMAMVIGFRHLGTGPIIGIGAALVLSYLLFLALGAVYFRLAVASSKSFRL